MVTFIIITILFFIVIIISADATHAVKHGSWGYNPPALSGIDRWRYETALREARAYLNTVSDSELHNCKFTRCRKDNPLMQEVMAFGLSAETAKQEIKTQFMWGSKR